MADGGTGWGHSTDGSSEGLERYLHALLCLPLSTISVRCACLPSSLPLVARGMRLALYAQSMPYQTGTRIASYAHAMPGWQGAPEYLCQLQGLAVGCGCYLSALDNYHSVTTVSQKMDEVLTSGEWPTRSG